MIDSITERIGHARQRRDLGQSVQLSAYPEAGSGETSASGDLDRCERAVGGAFHAKQRSNDTDALSTDPDVRLYSEGRGKEAKLSFMGHALMEDRNGLIVDAATTRPSGHAERLAALELIDPHASRLQPITLGADKGPDAKDFAEELRDRHVTPHVAQNGNGRGSAIDGRTTRHAGYRVSTPIRKRIEEAFVWAKTIAGLRKMRHRCLRKSR